MVYAQPRIHPGECNTQNSLGFCDKNRSSNLSQTTRSSDSEQKEENMLNCGLCCSGRPQSQIERKRKER